jgi:hypothetical protein
LLVVYQILQEIGNLVMYNHDLSWYDIEGYAIGFSYHVLASILKNNHDNNKISSSSVILDTI